MAIREVAVVTKTREEAVAIMQKCITLGVKPYHGDGTAEKAVMNWDMFPCPGFDNEGDLVNWPLDNVLNEIDFVTEEELLAHAAHIAAIQL